jgi:hypothetical protein
MNKGVVDFGCIGTYQFHNDCFEIQNLLIHPLQFGTDYPCSGILASRDQRQFVAEGEDTTSSMLVLFP